MPPQKQQGREKPRPRIPQPGPYHRASKTISRVLYLTVIYLDVPLPARSSHPGSSRASLYAPIPVLLRIEFTASRCSHVMGELLPRLSTLTPCPDGQGAVYLCCTFPEVAFGGRYPLSLPCGARTFLIDGLSACPRDCLFSSRCLFYRKVRYLSMRSAKSNAMILHFSETALHMADLYRKGVPHLTLWLYFSENCGIITSSVKYHARLPAVHLRSDFRGS